MSELVQICAVLEQFNKELQIRLLKYLGEEAAGLVAKSVYM